MEAAAEQLAAAKRVAEAQRREEAITEVEMVLQTYFHNLDNSYNKLQTINEYMDDVEVRMPISAVHMPLDVGPEVRRCCSMLLKDF